jgi:hypothetical protein
LYENENERLEDSIENGKFITKCFYLDLLETLELFLEFAPHGSPAKRPSNGVRLHALRIRKSDDFAPELKEVVDTMLSAFPKRKASLTHVLRVRKSDPAEEDLF